jgi:AcrR family transcriptional regulator
MAVADLFKTMFQSAKRRIKKARQDHRTHRLYGVGYQILNTEDHERVSVARIAREAGVSVGAFYERFESKDVYLRRLSWTRLDWARRQALTDLDPKRWRDASGARTVRTIVEHVLHTVNSNTVGAVRIAVKCGRLDPDFLKPLLTYRAVVADQAVVLLKPHVKFNKDPEVAIRAAVQITLATAIDALFQDEGPLRAGRRLMADTLSHMMSRLLGIADRRGELAGEDSGDSQSDEMIVIPPDRAAAFTIDALMLKDGDEIEKAMQPILVRKALPKTVVAPTPAPAKVSPPPPRRRPKRFL